MKKAILPILILLLLIFLGCTQPTVNNSATNNQNGNDNTGLPNPASVYCEQQGGTLEIKETSEGQIGYCYFDDGRICEEWVFFNSKGAECIPPEEDNEMPSEEFCGTSTYGPCENDSDCMRSGCSSSVCQAVSEGSLITTCEWRDCYNPEPYDLECVCSDGVCMWE